MESGSSSKGWVRPLRNVFVRMETPVVYFYSETPFQAQVNVGFHGGSISQWYPARSDGEVPPAFTPGTSGTIDFAAGYDGWISWDVDVLARDEALRALPFRGHETLSWVYPRQTDSNLLRVGEDEYEKYLFYRGVGNFSLPVRFHMEGDDLLHVDNLGGEALGRLFVFDQDSGAARFWLLDSLGAGASVSVDLSELERERHWHRSVYDTLRQALVEEGLYAKEADAMLQTWWRSYFEKPGLRVFWVVPEEATESILPLQVSPAPGERARVLVGRTEILTPSFEAQLVDEFQDKKRRSVWRRDRYFGSYTARVAALGAAASGAVGPTQAPTVARTLQPAAVVSDLLGVAADENSDL